MYEPILERGFSVATSRICVCKLLTFHENRKDEFVIWSVIVEHPDVDETISKFLALDDLSGKKKLEMTEEGGVSPKIDFSARSSDIGIDLDINFRQKHYRELPILQFKVGHSCRVQFKLKCRINPLLCDNKEKIGIIRYFMGSKFIHDARIDTSLPVPDFEAVPVPLPPEYSKEAIEKLLSAESLHNLAYCLSEDEGFELALGLGISSDKVSKVLIMYGSVESKNFRLFLLWKKDIRGHISDIKNFMNAFYEIDRGDLAFGIDNALNGCTVFTM